jgi:hypothetical protein
MIGLRSVHMDITYDDSEFPECRGWRPSVSVDDQDHELTSIYGPGLATAAEAVAVCEKWAQDRGYRLDIIEVTAISVVPPKGGEG